MCTEGYEGNSEWEKPFLTPLHSFHWESETTYILVIKGVQVIIYCLKNTTLKHSGLKQQPFYSVVFVHDIPLKLLKFGTLGWVQLDGASDPAGLTGSAVTLGRLV